MDQLILKQAKKLGVKVYPSKNPDKKLDVYYKGKHIASVGAKGYNDYYIYLRQYGTDVAEERRRLYKIRHEKDLDHLNGYLAWVLLWNGD
jgi:metal-dependent HD superfamily phosphatase/phosphodiesterase